MIHLSKFKVFLFGRTAHPR